MLYSKNGSIPKPETDGTEGWIEVPDAPVAPEGKEVVWWYPPGWVVRDPKPEAREGNVWSWSQSTEQWVEYVLPNLVISSAVESNVSTITSSDISSLSTSQIEML
jgi:hypothetical protein